MLLQERPLGTQQVHLDASPAPVHQIATAAEHRPPIDMQQRAEYCSQQTLHVSCCHHVSCDIQVRPSAAVGLRESKTIHSGNWSGCNGFPCRAASCTSTVAPIPTNLYVNTYHIVSDWRQVKVYLATIRFNLKLFLEFLRLHGSKFNREVHC